MCCRSPAATKTWRLSQLGSCTRRWRTLTAKSKKTISLIRSNSVPLKSWSEVERVKLIQYWVCTRSSCPWMVRHFIVSISFTQTFDYFELLLPNTLAPLQENKLTIFSFVGQSAALSTTKMPLDSNLSTKFMYLTEFPKETLLLFGLQHQQLQSSRYVSITLWPSQHQCKQNSLSHTHTHTHIRSCETFWSALN